EKSLRDGATLSLQKGKTRGHAPTDRDIQHYGESLEV
ncbi:MAG: hypothetical protein ACI9KE_005803, partial [Polyangiales bacterium]